MVGHKCARIKIASRLGGFLAKSLLFLPLWTVIKVNLTPQSILEYKDRLDRNSFCSSSGSAKCEFQEFFYAQFRAEIAR